MPITYSTDLEEIAAHKDADALRQAANYVIVPQLLTPNTRDATFFDLGRRFGEMPCVTSFTWHGDGKTLLVFAGMAFSLIEKRVRAVKEIEEKDMR